MNTPFRYNLKRVLSHISLFMSLVGLLSCSVPPPPVETVPPPPPPAEFEILQPVGWEEIDGWPGTDLLASFEAFVESCRVLRHKDEWLSLIHI